MNKKVFLFGESERGERLTSFSPQKGIVTLFHTLGMAPSHSRGLFYAIQTILYGRELLFYRVEQEGFSMNDYIQGFHLLHEQAETMNICALGFPGVGDPFLLREAAKICHKIRALLLICPEDLYDYLTFEPGC